MPMYQYPVRLIDSAHASCISASSPNSDDSVPGICSVRQIRGEGFEPFVQESREESIWVEEIYRSRGKKMATR